MPQLPKKFKRAHAVEVRAPPILLPRRRSAAEGLLDRGWALVTEFCRVNALPVPALNVVPKEDWQFDVCAYYRPDGIRVCLEHCGRPCGEATNRNWSWPGSTTDRTPYGVVCHELGHFLDWLASEEKGAYFGDFSVKVRGDSKENPLTRYCDNDAEWFAEMARLFLTNHALLKQLRPKTWGLLRDRWTPVSDDDWKVAMGNGVPERVLKSLNNKGAR